MGPLGVWVDVSETINLLSSVLLFAAEFHFPSSMNIIITIAQYKNMTGTAKSIKQITNTNDSAVLADILHGLKLHFINI